VAFPAFLENCDFRYGVDAGHGVKLGGLRAQLMTGLGGNGRRTREGGNCTCGSSELLDSVSERDTGGERVGVVGGYMRVSGRGGYMRVLGRGGGRVREIDEGVW
jgi:hypothetical protein